MSGDLAGLTPAQAANAGALVDDVLRWAGCDRAKMDAVVLFLETMLADPDAGQAGEA